MTQTEFKDVFAGVPRHVAVLGLYQENVIHGVTISSLQTVSIDEDQQILSFTLRSTSFFASKLKQGLPFTFNILSGDQIAISELYSNPKRINNEEINSKIWTKLSGDIVFVENAYLSASTRVINSIDVGSSSVFFFLIATVLSYKSTEVLLYGKRTYGTFTENFTQ